MTSHDDKPTILQLVRSFVRDQPPILYWRDEWFAWNGTHYEQARREGIEYKAMGFLESRSPVTISSAAVQGFMELLRINQFCGQLFAPAWLDGRKRPSPTEVFAVSNGLLQVPAARGATKLLSHDPAFLGLSSAGYGFSPTARCRGWLRFLDELWPGGKEAKGLLQEWFGYCLLPDTSQQKILAIIGPARSGKSTIARVLRELVGPRNVASPSIHSLSGQFGLWGLLDKSVAIVPDATLPRPCPALEEVLKSISGEDAVDVHRKGLPPLTGVRLPTRLVIVANEQPAFQDPSGALRQRVLTLRTVRSFSGKEDVRLTDKLLKELPGILNWAIEGRKRLYSRARFDAPADVNVDREALLRAVPDGDRVSHIVVHYRDHRIWRRGPRARRRGNARF